MEALPEELLARILSHLCNDSASSVVIQSHHAHLQELQRRLAALCAGSQVYKTFYRTAEPLLYKTLNLRITSLWPCKTFDWRGYVTSVPVLTLLSSLFARPQRQQYVSRLYIAEEDASWRGWINNFPPGLSQLVRNTIYNLHLPHKLEADFANAVEGETSRPEHGLAMMIICLCPKLRFSYVDGSGLVLSSTTLWGLLEYCGESARASTRTVLLKHLENPQMVNVDANLCQFGPLLQLPELRSFDISHEEVQEFQFTAHDPKFTSNRTKLSVRDAG